MNLSYAVNSTVATPAAPGLLQRKCACGGNPGPSGECEACRKKRLGLVQRSVVHRAPTAAVPQLVHTALSTPGQPLETRTRAFMESRFGHDFGSVRIHTDSTAGQSARAVDALAYTVGQDIVFGAGQYAPHSPDGQKLIAHELTHTVQQERLRPAVQTPLQVTDPHDAAEQEAEQAARAVSSGQASGASQARGPQLARQVATPQTGAPAAQPAPANTCDLNRCVGSQADIVRADLARGITYVTDAIAALNASSLSGNTQRALDWYFNSHSVETVKQVRTTFGDILGALQETLSNNNFGCDPDYVGPWEAYVSANQKTGSDNTEKICITASYWSDGPEVRARSVVHECAHRVGMSPERKKDIYWHSSAFRFLDTSEALFNSDSYARFAGSLKEGTPATLPLSVSAAGGFAASAKGSSTWQASLYGEIELQHPQLRVFNPTLGVGIVLVGESTTGGSAPVSSGTSLLYSLVAGVRIADPRPGESGGAYLSLFGGPALAMDNMGLGFEAGAAAGYRWKKLSVSANAGYVYDPGRESGMKNVLTGGVGVTFTPDFFNIGGK